MNSKIVIVVTALTVAVGAIVFGYSTVQSMKIDRSQLQETKIKVASYPAFISSYGPGPELAKRFEEKTGVKVELINGGDPTLIINRLVTDEKLSLDVVIGIDQVLLKQASEQLKWKTLDEDLFQSVKPELLLSDSRYFLPIDWSPLTFIFKSNDGGEPRRVSSLKSVFEGLREEKLALESVQASLLGSQWLYWFQLLNLPIETFEKNKNEFRIANSWSQAYGLFKSGSVDVVFSYLTSVVFHWSQEKDRSYSFYEIEEGHPFQVDTAGVLERCKECGHAKDFVRFLLEPGSQALIMQKNFMLPARKSFKPSGEFSKLPDLKLISYDNLPDYWKNKSTLAEKYLKKMQ